MWIGSLLFIVGCVLEPTPLGDVHNYHYASELTAQSVRVKEATDLTIDWSSLEHDLHGDPIVSAVAPIVALKCRGPVPEMLDRIATDQLGQADCQETFVADPAPPGTAIASSELQIAGHHLDPKYVLQRDEADLHWLVAAYQPTRVGSVVRSLTLVELDADETSTLVPLTDTSATLTYDANVSEMGILVRAGSTSLDWSGVSTDARGAPFTPQRASIAVVAHLDDDISTLPLHRLLDEATELYTLNVFEQTAADLSAATTEDGRPFDGFTRDGHWVFALYNPHGGIASMPVYLARLVVR